MSEDDYDSDDDFPDVKPKKTELTYKETINTHMQDRAAEQRWPAEAHQYAARDAEVTRALMAAQMEYADSGLRAFYRRVLWHGIAAAFGLWVGQYVQPTKLGVVGLVIALVFLWWMGRSKK